jgi:para-aminobenzoate synthetase/4-amino-4-deoxychorismate lyase
VSTFAAIWTHKATRRSLGGQDIPPVADRWQPDRSRGVFETLLVVDGEPVELEAHLRRLARSLDGLYGLKPPKGTGEQLQVEAGELELGRLRLTATPSRGTGDQQVTEVDLAIEADAIEPKLVFPAHGVRLLTQPLSGGLGPHKLVDRPKGIGRPSPDEAGVLLIDEGEVLEAGWANVFAVRGGTLFTPPLDGRILPGTTRAALLALAASEEIETAECPLSPADLLNADETFLTGSIRGVEAALELDEQPLPGCGPISNRLAAALQQRWGLASEPDAPPALATAPIRDQLSR